jgi:3-oxoacyl-[acyl-carrier-protein] synthase-3
VEEFGGWTEEKIESKTGIRERHIAAPDETALDLARPCAAAVIDAVGSAEIGALLFCTQSPDYLLPTTACLLQHQLGLPTTTAAFDINLGCSGFVYGLAVAKGLISGGVARKVLLVTADTYTKYCNAQDKSTRAIFGDGAAATLIEACDSEGIGEFVLGTDGSGHSNLIVPQGGLRARFDPGAVELTDEDGNTRSGNNLYMNGPEIFNFTIQAVPKVVREVLEKNHCTAEDLDYVVFHQANRFMLEHLRRKLPFPPEKFHNDLLHTGNTVSSTIPIALKDAWDRGLVASGSRILAVGFGVGYSWGGTIVTL